MDSIRAPGPTNRPHVGGDQEEVGGSSTRVRPGSTGAGVEMNMAAGVSRHGGGDN
jgi:hypothetical protein